MMSSDVTTEISALYYPCIEIHDVNFLKATLLVFGQVKRMVPPRDEVQLRDLDEVREFCETEGPRGHLLTEATIDSGFVLNRQHLLCEKIKSLKDDLHARYSPAR